MIRWITPGHPYVGLKVAAAGRNGVQGQRQADLHPLSVLMATVVNTKGVCVGCLSLWVCVVLSVVCLCCVCVLSSDVREGETSVGF